MAQQIDPRKFTKIINEADIKKYSCQQSLVLSPIHRKTQVLEDSMKHLLISNMVAGGLAFLTSITHGIFIGLKNKGKVILAKNLIYYCKRWMTKMAMPPRWGRLDGSICRFIWGRARLQWVEATFIVASKEWPLCCLILDNKIIRVKFNERMIIRCESMNKGKIFTSFRDIKDIV